jgi:hypothetical protein
MLKRMITKLNVVTSAPLGWLSAIFFTVINFFAPEAYSFGLVFVAVFLDAVFGIAVAVKKRGDFALSKLARLTLFKLAAYAASLIIIYMIEMLIHDKGFIGIKIAAGWAAACEFWSLSAHVLILNPNIPFFRIMRKYLRGEIESKLDTLNKKDKSGQQESFSDIFK